MFDLSARLVSDPKLKNLAGMRLRANPEYEWLPTDRLRDGGGPQLDQSGQMQDLFGVLRSREPEKPIVKALRQETAQLYLALQEPGHLPAQVQAELGDDSNRVIATLVLDRILEIEHEGQFVTGASAYALLWETLPVFRPRGAIARLSIEALQIAQALATEGSGVMASRLYHYNRMPASPAWLRKLGNSEAIAAFLGIGTGQAADRLLAQSWQAVEPSASNQGWLAWRLRSGNGRHDRAARTYKLYVSPRCEFVPEAFAATVATFTEARTPVFKTGCDVYGLLRPDKLIGYFWSYEEMQSTATRLQERLADCPAHGVPFTAEISGDGILSWGIDPPDDEVVLGVGQESWRSWLARRMATALLEASQARLDGVQPWELVLGRLWLDGVDTDTWTPTTALWN